MELLYDWDIADDWRDYHAVLEPLAAGELEAQVAWLVRHHCTNKETAKILSSIREERVTAESVKRRLDRLCARLGVNGRGCVARKLARLVDERRVARSASRDLGGAAPLQARPQRAPVRHTAERRVPARR
jgi:hypothetical protein